MSLTKATALCVALAPAALTTFGTAQQLQIPTTGAYLAIPHHPDLVPQAGITVEGWVSWNGAFGVQNVIRKDPTAFGESYNLKIESGRPQWNVFDANGIRTLVWPGTQLQSGQATHLAGTWDGTVANMYVNGVLAASTASRPTMLDNGGELRLGPGGFSGELDEVRIWNYARSEQQVNDTMRQEVDCEVGQIATFHFDNGFADSNLGVVGTPVGTVNLVAETAPFDRALDLAGQSAWVELPDNSVLEPQTGITVEAWVQWSGLNFGRPTVFRKDPNPNAESYNLRIEFGRPQWAVFTPSGARTLVWPMTQLPIGQRVHLAATWDGSECALYMNGSLLSTTPVVGAGMRDSAGDLRFGRGGDLEAIAGQFDGQIDEVRIWDHARSAEEIDNARLLKIHRAQGLIGAWHFEGDFRCSTDSALDGTANGPAAFSDEFVPFDCSDSPCFETAIGDPLNMADDDLRTVNLGFAFPLPGGGTTSAISACSNGYVWLVDGSSTDADFSPTAGEFTSQPARLAPMWRDFNPADALSDDVYANVLADRVVITWNDLVQFNLTQQQTVQLQMFPDGRYTFFYGPSLDSVSSQFGPQSLIGCWDGASADPGSIDLSSAIPFATGSNPNYYESYPMAADVDLRNVRIDHTPDGSGYTLAYSCPGDSGFASVTSFGVGCPASNPMTIDVTVPGMRPILGSVASVSLTNTPADTSIAALHLGFDQLDLDLSILNLAGCSFYTTPSITLPIAVGTPLELQLSSNPAGSGVTLNFQAIGISPSSTTFGAILSNRLELTLGTY